jgi:hypothetical protein
LRLALGIRGEIGEDEEFPSGGAPARSLRDRTRSSVCFVEFAVAAMGIRLDNASEVDPENWTGS